MLSLEILIKDINAENVVFIGKERDNDLVRSTLNNFKNSGDNKIEYLSNNKVKNFLLKNEMLNIKYDSKYPYLS